MIRLDYSNQTQMPDLVRDGGNLETSDLLNTAIFISLFTRQQAQVDDALPDLQSTNREGWWADAFTEIEGERLGSRLWLLSRAKASTDTLNRAKTYAEEALQWLLDDGIVSDLAVEVERQEASLAFKVSLTKPSAPTSRWQSIWTAHLAAL